MSFKLPLSRFKASALGAFLLIVCVFFTSVGHQVVAFTASTLFSSLHISLKEGRLLSGGEFDLNWETEDLRINLSGAKLKLNLFECATFCLQPQFEHISIKLAKAATTPATTEPPKEDVQSEPFSMPVSVGIEDASINALDLDLGELTVNLDKLGFSLFANEQTITSPYIGLDQIVVTDNRVEADATEPLTDLPALAHIIAPKGIKFELQALAVNEFKYIKSEQVTVVNSSRLQVSYAEQTLSWSDLYLELGQRVLRSNGTVVLSDDKNDVNTISSLSDPQGLTLITAKGPLNELHIRLSQQGQYHADISGRFNFQQDNWPFELKGNVIRVPVEYTLRGNAYLAHLNSGSIQASGLANAYQFSFASDVQQHQLDNARVELNASGGFHHLQLEKAGLFANKSSVELTGRIEWKEALKTQLVGGLNKLPLFFIDDAAYLDGHFALDFINGQQGWHVDISELILAGQLQNKPLLVQANLQLDKDLYGNIEQLSVKYGASELKVRGDLQQKLSLQGDFNLAHQQDNVLPIDVTASGEFSLNGAHQAPKLELSAAINQFKHSQLTAQQGQLSLTLDLEKELETLFDLHFAELKTKSFKLQQLHSKFRGNRSAHQMYLVSQGDAQLSAVITGGLQQNTWHGRINHAQVIYDDFLWSGQSAEDVIVRDLENWQVNQFCGSLNGAPWCLAGQTKKSAGQVQLDINNLALDPFSKWLPAEIQVEGKTSVEAKISWFANGLKSAAAQLNSDEIKLAGAKQTIDLKSVQIDLNADVNNAHFSAGFASRQLGDVSTEFHIPIQGSQPQAPSGIVHIANMPLTPLARLIDEQLEHPLLLEGVLQGDIRFSGEPTKPSLFGKVGVTSLALEHSSVPIQLERSSLQLDLKGKHANILGTLNSKQGGELALNGSLNWQNVLLGQLQATGEALPVYPYNGIELKVSPDLQIGFEYPHLTVAGKLVIPEGRVKINSVPQQVVTVSDDQVFIDEVDTKQSESPIQYSLDIDLDIEDNFRVYAFGLDSYIAGQLNLNKTPQTPLLSSGELSLREGVYQALGQDLQIQQGLVGFNGPINKPYLNIRAIRNPDVTADDVTAGIELTGSVANPSLRVYSEPAMDQAHALSYLLNGQPLEQSEDNNSAVLSQILLSQGINLSENYVARAGKKLGLEDVSVNAKGSGKDTQVELSGYITPSIQVSYRVGVFDALNEIAVRYRVFSKLYIEATSGLYDSIDILYQFDWDNK